MDAVDIIATTISLISLGVAVAVMMRTARRNEIDKILSIVTDMQKDISQKAAVDAVQDNRLARAERDIIELKGSRT